MNRTQKTFDLVSLHSYLKNWRLFQGGEKKKSKVFQTSVGKFVCTVMTLSTSCELALIYMKSVTNIAVWEITLFSWWFLIKWQIFNLERQYCREQTVLTTEKEASSSEIPVTDFVYINWQQNHLSNCMYQYWGHWLHYGFVIMFWWPILLSWGFFFWGIIPL